MTPRVARMTRLLLGIVAAVLLSSCSSTDGSPSGDSADQLDAAAFKQEMDAKARSLLPDLVAALGGELGGMQATFYERGGFGIYDYTASGVLSGPRGTVAAKLDAATEVLEQHDYAIERDDAKETGHGHQGRRGGDGADRDADRRPPSTVPRPSHVQRRRDPGRGRLRRERFAGGLPGVPGVTTPRDGRHSATDAASH